MRNLLLFKFLVLLCFSTSVFSQSPAYEYLGVIKLNDTSFISYRLAFEEVDGKIDGYSLSDIGGKHETKSNIKGTYNKDENVLIFQEYNIVYTKSPITEFDMCLINFEGKLRNLKKNKAFSGNFKGLYPDGKPCRDGLIIVSNARKVEERIAKFDTKVQKSKKISQEVKDKVSMRRTLDTLTMSVIKKNENLNVFTKTKNVIISIYDAGKVDDDRINLYVDGKLILENYSILREKKEIPITITKEFTTIKVTALNVGDSAPNTVKVEILDGTNLITTRTSLDTNESAVLTLVNQ
ncbi:hypothetical protein [uncultured Dokdonia sp.]|uniref:hypothetical protein n=1 Tax=uncultured Dokdonia sp. TaxID=575653 RepID=UPI0026203F55|nr:hypothetical protein [uncultured Dokdonia sp.]